MSYLDLLSPTTQRRVERYAAMRRAVGDKRFDAWIEKRVKRRHDADAKPPIIVKPAPYSFLIHGKWVVQVKWLVDGHFATFTGRAKPTIAEAFTAFYERHPDYAHRIKDGLRAKGYDEYGNKISDSETR